ncbi:MAG: SRPBCC domain-containing protein [Rhodospirillaceae bacterium]|nr:SRPBCC domain-containing protein [Rhodospirillaceae bacterium]
MTRPALPTNDGIFTLTRRFSAPRALVWRAWSEAEHLGQWWGPKACTPRVERLEFRPGGIFHYAMVPAEGDTLWGRFLYREIAAPERIVWLNAFATHRGGIARAPFAPAFPLEVENTVTLAEDGAATLLALRSVPFGATEEEEAVFRGLFASMQAGFGGTLDRLAEHLG